MSRTWFSAIISCALMLGLTMSAMDASPVQAGNPHTVFRVSAVKITLAPPKSVCIGDKIPIGVRINSNLIYSTNPKAVLTLNTTASKGKVDPSTVPVGHADFVSLVYTPKTEGSETLTTTLSYTGPVQLIPSDTTSFTVAKCNYKLTISAVDEKTSGTNVVGANFNASGQISVDDNGNVSGSIPGSAWYYLKGGEKINCNLNPTPEGSTLIEVTGTKESKLSNGFGLLGATFNLKFQYQVIKDFKPSKEICKDLIGGKTIAPIDWPAPEYDPSKNLDSSKELNTGEQEQGRFGANGKATYEVDEVK